MMSILYIYKLTLNPVLIEHFNFAENTISLSNTFLIIGIFIAPFYSNDLLNYRMNFVHKIKNLLIFFFISLCIDYIAIKEHFEILFIANRLLEGYVYTNILFIIEYYLSLKLIRNENKGTINSFKSSFTSLMKFALPLVGVFLITNVHLLSNLFIAMFITISLYIWLTKNEKILLKEYMQYNKRKLNIILEKRKSMSIGLFMSNNNLFNILKELLSIEAKQKKLYLYEKIIKNMLRPWYDLYFLLYFNLVLKYSLMESIFLISASVLGQSLSLFVGYFSDKLNEKEYQLFKLIMEVLFAFFMLISLFNGYLDLNYYVLVVIMFFVGFTRNMFSDYQNRVSLIYSEENPKLRLNNIKTLLHFISEGTHFISYLLLTLLFFLYSYNGIIYFFISLLILNLLLSNYIYFSKQYTQVMVAKK